MSPKSQDKPVTVKGYFTTKEKNLLRAKFGLMPYDKGKNQKNYSHSKPPKKRQARSWTDWSIKQTKANSALLYKRDNDEFYIPGQEIFVTPEPIRKTLLMAYHDDLAEIGLDKFLLDIENFKKKYENVTGSFSIEINEVVHNYYDSSIELSVLFQPPDKREITPEITFNQQEQGELSELFATVEEAHAERMKTERKVDKTLRDKTAAEEIEHAKQILREHGIEIS